MVSKLLLFGEAEVRFVAEKCVFEELFDFLALERLKMYKKLG